MTAFKGHTQDLYLFQGISSVKIFNIRGIFSMYLKYLNCSKDNSKFELGAKYRNRRHTSRSKELFANQINYAACCINCILQFQRVIKTHF